MVKPIIGQTKDGYIYGEETTPNATTQVTPTIQTSPLPFINQPGTIPSVPVIDKNIVQKVNAPVNDTLKLNQRIDSTSERTKQLREHFKYLETKGELVLNDKQSDYVKRFKTKYPDYENVPDAILYGKVILTDPKTMDKYGNIGEKTFLQRLGNATYGNITAIGDAILEGKQAYQNYNVKDGGAMNEGIAIVSGLGKFAGDTFTNVGANLINLVTPAEDKLKGTTSTSELLGKNVGETLSNVGDFTKSGIDWFAGEGWTEDTVKNITDKVQSSPEAMKEFEAAMNILNILPGGFANQSTKALTAKQVLKNIARDAELTMGKKGVFGTATKEAFDVGMNRGVSEGLMTGAKTTNEWLKTLPDETQKIATTVEKNVNKNKEVLQGIRNTQTGEKILSKADKQGFDPVDDIARYEELQPVIDSDGRIDTTQAIDNLNAYVEPKAKTVRELIVAENKRVSLDEFASNIKKEIADNKSDIVNNPRWRKVVDDAIETARRDFGDANGTIPLEVVDDIKKSMYDASNFLNPDDTAIKAIARGAKQTIEDNVTSADIKALNQELSRWYSTRSYLKSIGVGKVIKGGRMGKYFAKLAGQGAGAIAGGMIGGSAGAFAGGVVGGEVADAIQGKILSGAIKKTGGAMPESELFGQARQTLSEGPKLLEGPSGKPTNYPSIYSREAEQLGRGEFPGANNKPNVIISNNPAEILAFEVSNGKIDVKKAIEAIKKLSPEEIAKYPELVKLQEVDQIVGYIDNVEAEYGVLPPEEITNLTKAIQEGKYTLEQKKYILDNSPKEIKSEIQKQNRIRDYGKDFTEKEVVEKKPVDKKKKERQITSKGKLAFIDKYEAISPNVGGEELYKIAKYFEDNNVEDLMSYGDEPVLAGPSAKQRKRYATDVKAFEEHKAKVKEYAKQVETAAEDMGVDADTLFNDIKDRYNGIDTGDIKGGSMDDNVSMMEQDYEARLEAKREMQSIQDQLDTMNEKIDSGIPETPIEAPKETPVIDTTPVDTPKVEGKTDIKAEIKKLDSEGKYGEIIPLLKDFKSADEIVSFLDNKRAISREASKEIYDYFGRQPEFLKKGWNEYLTKDFLNKNTMDDLVEKKAKDLVSKQTTKKLDLNRIKTDGELDLGKIRTYQDELQKEYMKSDYNDTVHYRAETKANNDNVDSLLKELSEYEKKAPRLNVDNSIRKIGTKPKSSLPMSQKSEVLYSKPDSLIQEARKYKSAEEFVKAQGEPAYHGGNVARETFDISKAGSKEQGHNAKAGFWFSNDINTAKGYGKNVTEIYPKQSIKNPKIVDAEGEMFGDMRDIIDDAIAEAKKNGNDGVIFKNLSDEKDWGNYNPTDHYVIFNPESIKTKKQLLDIYNKANKK